jgi:hypothetical protein
MVREARRLALTAAPPRGPRRRLRLARASAEVAEAALDTFRLARYCRYWSAVRPRDDRQRFNRWLFAFASVQTGWARNAVVYRALSAPGVCFDPAPLRRVLDACGAGMVQVRTRGLSRFHADYWADPSAWLPRPGESFAACRDRLVPRVTGLGLAKVSFALELCSPLACDVVCLDRHLLRIYGVDPEHATDRQYRRAEAHWRASCARRRVPCPVARHICWDAVQGRRSTRYWSHVFERENPRCPKTPRTPSVRTPSSSP